MRVTVELPLPPTNVCMTNRHPTCTFFAHFAWGDHFTLLIHSFCSKDPQSLMLSKYIVSSEADMSTFQLWMQQVAI